MAELEGRRTALSRGGRESRPGRPTQFLLLVRALAGLRRGQASLCGLAGEVPGATRSRGPATEGGEAGGPGVGGPLTSPGQQWNGRERAAPVGEWTHACARVHPCVRVVMHCACVSAPMGVCRGGRGTGIAEGHRAAGSAVGGLPLACWEGAGVPGPLVPGPGGWQWAEPARAPKPAQEEANELRVCSAGRCRRGRK